MLCRGHLLGEHRELHAAWTILTEDRRGYRAHPEVQRWSGKLAALYERHERLVREMTARGFAHRSPLDRSLASGDRTQDVLLASAEEQIRLLTRKACPCPLAVGGKARDRRAAHAGGA